MVVFLMACSSKKRISTIENRSKVELINALINRNLAFEWFEGKCSTSIESPDENISGSMVVKMHKNKALLVAIKKFGFEVARFFADQEGFVILYRLEKSYEQGTAKEISKIISLQADFVDIQQLIFGNVLLPDVSTLNVRKDSLEYVVTGTANKLTMEYHLSGHDLRLNKYIITDAFGRQAVVEYSNYKLHTDVGNLAYDRQILFTDNNGEKSKISVEFTDIVINKALDIKFQIPEGYEKIN